MSCCSVISHGRRPPSRSDGNGAFSIAYDTEMRLRLQRLARRRGASVDYAEFLSGENDEMKRYLKSDLGMGRPTGQPHTKKPFLKKNKKGDNPNYIQTGAMVLGIPESSGRT